MIDPHAHARIDALEGRVLRVESEGGRTAEEIAKQTPMLARLADAVGEPAHPFSGRPATGLSRVASEWIEREREREARRARWSKFGRWSLSALGALGVIVAIVATVLRSLKGTP
jgi:hypothetical protein